MAEILGYSLDGEVDLRTPEHWGAFALGSNEAGR